MGPPMLLGCQLVNGLPIGWANAFYWPKLLYPYYSLLLFFAFSSFCLYSDSIGWYCGAGVFGLIECISLFLSLALPTIFNNNNKKSPVAAHGWLIHDTYIDTCPLCVKKFFHNTTYNILHFSRAKYVSIISDKIVVIKRHACPPMPAFMCDNILEC